MLPKRLVDRFFALLLALSGCQTMTGPMGEIPVAASQEGETGWELVYAASPQTAAATNVAWILYRIENGTRIEQWAAPGVAVPSGAPFAIAAQLVDRPFAPPTAWVAASYAGNQYRLHKFTDGREQHWTLPGEPPPSSARMHVTQHPSGVTWVTFEQPQFHSAVAPARELIALDADSALIESEGVLWAECDSASCRVLREAPEAYVVEVDGVEVMRYETPPDIFVPFRAVCRDSQNAPVLVTEDSAYPLLEQQPWPVTSMTARGFERRADGSYRLPDSFIERFYEFGRLYCDRPRDWLWVSESAAAAYQLVFAEGRVTPLEPALPALLQYAARRDAQGWNFVYAKEEPVGNGKSAERTMSCNSPSDFFGTCTATYVNFAVGELALKAKP